MLSSLIGLTREKRKARVAIKASLRTGEPFRHTLLYGIGGTGKTAFARAIGDELGYYFFETHGASYLKPHQLFDALLKQTHVAQQRRQPLLFFLDEIHGLRLGVQEALYSPMKEWWIPTQRGKQKLPPFTLFGATTRFDLLDPNSFVTRFANKWEIHRYRDDEIEHIVAYEFDKLGLKYNSSVVADIARRCLGIPRNAVTLAETVRLQAVAAGRSEISLADVKSTFELEEIDEIGLQPVHRRYLEILASSVTDGHLVPLGIGAIAGKMRQHEDMIKGSVEPILLELNFVSPTPRGRILTRLGAEYLKKRDLSG